MPRKGRNKGISVDDLFTDPEFCKRQQEKLEALRKAEIEDNRRFAPLLRELAHAGFKAQTIYDIPGQYAPLPSAAVEILLESIPAFSDDGSKEVVVRQLSAAAEPFDGRALVACFGESTSSTLRWAVLNTIACARPHSIGTWLNQARRDTYIERTLRGIGQRIHGLEFEEYLGITQDTEAAAFQPADAIAKGPTRYEQVFGPVLEKLALNGFKAHSIEELMQLNDPIPPKAVEILISFFPSVDEWSRRLLLEAVEKAAGCFDGGPLVAWYNETSDNKLRRRILELIAVMEPHSIDGWLNARDPGTKHLMRLLARTSRGLRRISR